MSEKLLPCPLCGGCPVLAEAMTEHWVSCGTCGASGGMHGRLKLAVEAWNRRTPAPEGEAWRTVPVEPTEAMIEAANALSGPGTGVNYVQLDPEDFYAAMLAASPVVPVGVSREDIAKTLFERHWSAVSASPKWPGDDDGSYWLWLADAILAALRPTDTGWRDIATANRGQKVIIYDPRWGVTEGLLMDDGTWGLATFNGQIMKATPTLWQPMPLPPAPTDTGANHD